MFQYNCTQGFLQRVRSVEPTQSEDGKPCTVSGQGVLCQRRLWVLCKMTSQLKVEGQVRPLNRIHKGNITVHTEEHPGVVMPAK